MGQTIEVHKLSGGGGGAPTGPAGGELQGTYPNPLLAASDRIKYDSPVIVSGTSLNIVAGDNKKAFFFTNGGIVNVTVKTDDLPSDFRVHLNSQEDSIVIVSNTATNGTVDNRSERVLYGTENAVFGINPNTNLDFVAVSKQVTPSVSFNFHKDGTVTTNAILVPPTGQNNPNPTGHGTADFGGSLSFAAITIEEFATNNTTSYIDFQFEYRVGDGTSSGPYSAGAGTPIGSPIRLNFPNTLGAIRYDFTAGIFLEGEVPPNSIIYCYVAGQTATSISGANVLMRLNSISPV